MKTFEKLENRYIFTGKLILAHAAHVGSGESNEKADFVLVRSNDRPYIPGSSLRGVMRSTVERIACGLEPENAANISCLLSKSNDLECISVNENTQRLYKALSERRDIPEMAIEKSLKTFLEQEGHLCNTCQLFGSTHFASKIKITDLYPIAGTKESIRTSVAIDRDTETSAQTALFNIEVLEPDTEFKFELIADNIDGKVEWGLLCIGLWEMIRGREDDGAFYIGAKSAAGLGRCYLDADSLMIRYFDGKEQLKKYLIEDRMPGKLDGQEAKSFIKGKIQAYLNREQKNAETNG